MRRVRERRRGEGERREGKGESLGLEIVPVIRKILLQAIPAATTAAGSGRPMGGESGMGVVGRKGACECGDQGNHRLLTDEDARPQIKEYPQPRESLGVLENSWRTPPPPTHTHTHTHTQPHTHTHTHSSLCGPSRGCGRYIWAPGSP